MINVFVHIVLLLLITFCFLVFYYFFIRLSSKAILKSLKEEIKMLFDKKNQNEGEKENG